MGLIKATAETLGSMAKTAGGNILGNAVSSLGSVVSDQYREYFYCDAFPEGVLAVKGKNKNQKGMNKGNDNIISNGSVIAVNEGQCMILVDQGKVTEICATPGEFIYDGSTEPSIFYGNLGENIKNSFIALGKRFAFGGEIPKDQRVYFINIKEVRNNLWGTSSPIPFFIHDKVTGFQGDISLMCNGEFSYMISDPIRFYTFVCTNFTSEFNKKEIHSILRSEFMTALQPALGSFSDVGLRYSQITTLTDDLTDRLNEQLSKKWGELRGLKVVSVTFNTLKATKEDEDRIKSFQDTAVFTNVNMAAARMVTAQANAMEAAASNENAGPMMAFAGMNMAQMAGGGSGVNAANLFAMGQQQQAAAPQAAPAAMAPADAGWTCACGTSGNSGKFCRECGAAKPADATGWTCSCGAVNKGKFCQECGSKKPAGAPLYKCDKCGWEPADPTNPPKFCPECGDVFDESDIQ